jgi:magnesium transporter
MPRLDAQRWVALKEQWPALSPPQRVRAFRELAHLDAEDLFQQLSAEQQRDLLLTMPVGERRFWIRTLAPDDAADYIQAAPEDSRGEWLALLDETTRPEVVALLAYKEDEAGGLMNPRCARLRPDMRVDEAISYLRRQALGQEGTFYYAYVLDSQQRLLGVISVRELFAAPAERIVADVMRTNIVTLTAHTDQEDVSRIFAEHGLLALPVVDADGRLAGVVAADDVMDVMWEEATEDIQRLGGTRPLGEAYLEMPLRRMIAHRGGWLAALLFGEMLTASAMARFQDDIARSVALALFVPLIISSGGNSGSQATTLVIRAMALGEVRLRHWWMVLSREMLSGLALGFLLGAIGLARILAWQGMFGSYGEHGMQLAAIVGLSLIGIVLWGSVSGAMLPFLLRSVGMDPATASAPLVATVVDVTGIIIYFTVARAIL